MKTEDYKRHKIKVKIMDLVAQYALTGIAFGERMALGLDAEDLSEKSVELSKKIFDLVESL